MGKLLQNLKQNKKLKVSLIIGILLIIFFYCGGVIVAQSADLSRLANQKAAYEQQLAEQKQENAELDAILQSDNKDDYMEQKARENGYVKSNEIVYYDISGGN